MYSSIHIATHKRQQGFAAGGACCSSGCSDERRILHGDADDILLYSAVELWSENECIASGKNTALLFLTAGYRPLRPMAVLVLKERSYE